MSSEDKDIVISLDGKYIIMLIIIIALVFFTITTYVNAMWTFRPNTISQYRPPPRPNREPVAEAGADQRVYVNETVYFVGAGSRDPDGTIESYSWSFGDDASASGVNASHVYASEGVYTATLTVTDDDEATASDTCIITTVALTPDEIAALPTSDAVEVLMRISPETAVEILVEVNISSAADVLEEMNMTAAVDIVEAAVYLNQTDIISRILLEMEESSAVVLIDVEPSYGAYVVESMIEINVTSCARWVEAAVVLDVQSTADLLEEVETDLLLELLIEITMQPSTPSTVAALFEAMTPEKVLEIVSTWVSLEKLPELGDVLRYLTPETLNNVYGGLTDAERATVYLYLSSETIAAIQVELLPLPDLTPILLKVSKLDRMGYTVMATIENQGSFESGKLTVDLITDTKLIDQIEIESLSAEASTTVTYLWRPIQKGAYTLKVTADPDNIVNELNETNNELTIAYGVELPDLTVSVKKVPTELVERKTYTIEVEVSNIGEEDTGTFDLTLEASGVTIKARWISTTVGTSDVEELDPGSSRSLQFSYEPEEAGAYTLEATVDSEEKVLEGDEANNIDKVSVTVEARRRLWPVFIAAVISVITVTAILLFVFRNRIFGSSIGRSIVEIDRD